MMFRQASSRNNRNKGFKVKHVLQICLLLAVCIWLLYQIKHSHDKKKAFDENNAKIANKVDSGNQSLKLGRKDLNHGVEETSEKHGEEEEREEEEEGKQEDIIDKERGDGDDEIDENDQEKVDEAAERGEEFSDEDKEAREEENEEKEENDGQSENAGSSENHDHEYKNSQEAREEHYKGDDASSAVVRDNQMIRTEVDNEGLRNSDEEHENDIDKKDSENDHKTNTTEDATVDQNDSKPKTRELPVAAGDDGTTVNNPSVNETSVEKGMAVGMFKLDNESLPNLPTDLLNQVTLQNNATVNTTEAPGLDRKNETPILESTQDQNAAINMGASDQNPSSENIGSEQVEKFNATDVLKETVTVVLEQSEKSNATTISEESQNPVPEQTTVAEQSEKSNTGAVVEETQAIVLEQTESNTTTVGEESQNVVSEQAAVTEKSEKVEFEQSEKSSTILQVEESGNDAASHLTTNENSDAAQSENIDSSASLVTQEEKDAITDLGTLPLIESEGSNTEDVAAE